MQVCGACLQHEPEAGESTTGMEDLLVTGVKDVAPQGLQPLQAGGIDKPPNEDPGEVGPLSSATPDELVNGPAHVL